jgi:hypothetical protein
MEAVVGDPDFPGQQNTKDSATLSQLKAMGQAARTSMKIMAAQLTLGIMFRDMYRLEKQFGDPRKWSRILGPDGIEYNFQHSELFVDDYEFDFTLGGYVGTRSVDFQQFVQGLGIIKDVPGLMAQFNMEEVAKVFAERSNIRGLDRILKKPGMMEPGYFRDPYDENRRMVLDRSVIEVMPGEQHTKHIPVHLRMLDVGMLPPDARQRVLQHYQMHVFMLMEDARAQGSVGGQIGQLQAMIGQLAGGSQAGAMPAGTQMEQTYNEAAGPVGVTQGGANNVRF